MPVVPTSKQTRVQKTGRERAHRIARMEDLHIKVHAVEGVVASHVVAEQASRDAHSVMIATDAVRRAMNSKAPLADDVAVLRNAGNQAIIRAAVDTIPEVALRHGVCNQQDLERRIPVLKKAVKQVVLVPDGGGMLSHIASSLFSSFLVRHAVLLLC